MNLTCFDVFVLTIYKKKAMIANLAESIVNPIQTEIELSKTFLEVFALCFVCKI